MATMKTLNGYGFDSAKLGGKAPEYYLNPKNLLRNANFREPVNTVGFSSGSTVGAWAGETVNEWYAYSNGATITLISSGISLLKGIYQEMSAVDLSRYEGKALTFAAKINGVVYAAQGVVNQTGAWHIIGQSATPYGNIRAEIQNDNKLFCIILNDTEATCEWAALYEGSYTADNVPPPFFYPQRLEMLNLGLPVQPRNLLDNSDFRNPVNQRGNSSYSGEYGVDRWRTWNSDTLNVSSGYITVNGRAFEYILPSVVKSTAHTLVAKKTDGSILLYTKNPKDNYTVADNGLGLGLDSNVVVSLPSGDYEWTALYEGSYTADTLPPYVPKGYAAELAECQRYYHVYTRYYTCGFVSGSAKNYYMTVNINSPMRCMPSVTLESYIARKHDGYSDRTGSNGVAPEKLSLYASSAYESGHIVIIDTITKAVDTNNINFSMQLNNLVLTADL